MPPGLNLFSSGRHSTKILFIAAWSCFRATSLFSLLLKYRPYDRATKKALCRELRLRLKGKLLRQKPIVGHAS
ncbi:conserved hypothetical protein [Ricinus communis]|uniref:Uncharacterized protein n=1 Tax=Ricinus communis TaxID=3988 RepID=B9SJD4_RICCO|nr:conserved hypothetical protein [Ricinus communis]